MWKVIVISNLIVFNALAFTAKGRYQYIGKIEIVDELAAIKLFVGTRSECQVKFKPSYILKSRAAFQRIWDLELDVTKNALTCNDLKIDLKKATAYFFEPKKKYYPNQLIPL